MRHYLKAARLVLGLYFTLIGQLFRVFFLVLTLGIPTLVVKCIKCIKDAPDFEDKDEEDLYLKQYFDREISSVMRTLFG